MSHKPSRIRMWRDEIYLIRLFFLKYCSKACDIPPIALHLSSLTVTIQRPCVDGGQCRIQSTTLRASALVFLSLFSPIIYIYICSWYLAIITIEAIPTTVTENGGTISVVATRVGYLQIPQSICKFTLCQELCFMGRLLRTGRTFLWLTHRHWTDHMMYCGWNVYHFQFYKLLFLMLHSRHVALMRHLLLLSRSLLSHCYFCWESMFGLLQRIQ